MHDTKIIEIRDRSTFIPALAVMVGGDLSRGGRMLWRAGYAPGAGRFVILHHLQTGEVRNDPNQWSNARTMPAAHAWLLANWDGVPDGGLIDVRVVLGETSTPCASEVDMKEIMLDVEPEPGKESHADVPPRSESDA